MIIKNAKWILLSLVFAGTGCTASGPIFSPAENPGSNKSLVYVYRPFNIVACGVAPYVYIDGVKHDSLKNNGYLVYAVEPGTRIIETNRGLSESLTVYLDVVAGNEYHIRWSVDTNTTGVCVIHTYTLGLIPKEYAIREIEQTKNSR